MSRVSKFRWLNEQILHPSRYHKLYYVDKGEYEQFVFGDRTIHMDVNTLDLVETPDELPDPVPAIPQYDFCNNKRLWVLSLNVTHACQLRCHYCYLSHFYPEMASKMSFETAKKAIDTLYNWDDIKKFQPEKIKSKLRYQIGFFGGEPLLNFPVVKEVVEYVTQKSSVFSFGMTTNGGLITPDIAKFLGRHNFSLVLSVDGPEEIHDYHRKYVDGRGSFQDVMKGLRCLRDEGVTKVTFRATFLPDLVRLKDRAEFLNDLCDQGYGRNVSIEPACLTEGCSYVPEELKFTEEFVQLLEDEYVEMGDWLACRLNKGAQARFHNIMTYAERFVKKKQYCSQCGGGVGYMAVNPEGKIHSCHREMSTKIGDLEKGGVDERERMKWVDNRHYPIPDCMKCKLRNVCGAPCREHNITATGNIHKNDPVMCEFYRNWIKAAVRVVDKTDAAKLQARFYDDEPVVGKSYSLVREGGGFGDVICMGGAAIQIKTEQPTAKITMCVPNEFIEVVEHLKGVDDVVGLGPLEQLTKIRRSRGAKLLKDQYSYMLSVPEGEVVDLWGPGYLYEIDADKPLKHSRTQIFAKQAGCKTIDKAIPIWRTTPDEKKRASQYLEKIGNKVVVAIAPRGTDSNRSLPDKLLQKLLDELKQYNIVYLDCVPPTVRHEQLWYPATSFCDSVAIAEQCDVLLTVDSAFLHVGAALRLPVVGIFTMTDSNPFRDLYPNLVIVENTNHQDRCKIPCNRSKKKGYTEACKDSCGRKDVLVVDDVMLGLMNVFKIAFHPEYRNQRMQRMAL